ncbi:MAG: hypothetical protein HYX96_08620 [Chloroflexi bacterium]|nr:hypothetical protein [Chloroflexota bacterium]
MSHIQAQDYSDEEYIRKGVLGAWRILLDAHNAVMHDFIRYRLPQPGRPIDVTKAEAHVERIEREWEAERYRRNLGNRWTGPPPFTRMPLNAKLYLHSVLGDEKLGETPHTGRYDFRS